MKAFIQNLFTELKDEMKKMFLEQYSQQEERISILESERALLQQQIINLKSAMCTSESNIEELEQYGRRLCLCIESVADLESKTSEDVFNNALDMCKKKKINISENDIDHAHRIDKPYVDNISEKPCKSIIVRFTSFRKRTLVYRGKKVIKDVRLKVDLTKKVHTFLLKANEYIKNIPKVKFCYGDINCRLKVRWEVTRTSDSFFSLLDQLKLIIEDDE